MEWRFTSIWVHMKLQYDLFTVTFIQKKKMESNNNSLYMLKHWLEQLLINHKNTWSYPIPYSHWILGA